MAALRVRGLRSRAHAHWTYANLLGAPFIARLVLVMADRGSRGRGEYDKRKSPDQRVLGKGEWGMGCGVCVGKVTCSLVAAEGHR